MVNGFSGGDDDDDDDEDDEGLLILSVCAWVNGENQYQREQSCFKWI